MYLFFFNVFGAKKPVSHNRRSEDKKRQYKKILSNRVKKSDKNKSWRMGGDVENKIGRQQTFDESSDSLNSTVIPPIDQKDDNDDAAS